MKAPVAGGIAGLAATIPMTVFMTELFKRLPVHQQYPLPPREITEDLTEKAGTRAMLREKDVTALTWISHFGYGALCGVAYSQIEKKIPGSPIVKGMGYGASVWAAGYLGWIPALSILKPATEHPPRRTLLMVTAHLVLGAALATIYAREIK